MKRVWVLVLAVVVVAAAGAAAVYWFTAVPDRVARDYRERAEPQHEKAEAAVEDAVDTFKPATFSEPRRLTRAIERAPTPRAYLTAVNRVTDRMRRQLAEPRRTIRSARVTLRRVDRDAFADVPDPPLLGDSEPVERTKRIARLESEYLRRAAAFLDRYNALILYLRADVSVLEDLGRAVGRGAAGLPKNPGSPEALAAPVDRFAESIDRVGRRYALLEPPPVLVRYQRATRRLVAALAGELRGLADAARALDLERARAFDGEIERAVRRHRRAIRGTLPRLIARSAYRRDIDRLEELERRIDRAYARLD